MPTATRSTPPVTLDPDDGLPVWNPGVGAPLVAEVLAWRSLGVGLRCQTWLGWSAPRWTSVVVKLARPHQVDHPRARLSLQREVQALENNPHPGLPRLYAADLTGTPPHLIEEHLDGPDLDDLLLRRRVRTSSIPLLARDLLTALQPLHDRGLAHLDVKPSNVIIRAGRPVLIDLGSARPIGDLQPAGQPVGTPGYASPEMEACAPIDPAMDVYGVGATLQEVWGGRRAPTVRARRVKALIDTLARPTVDDRPTLTEAVALSTACGTREADATLPPWLRATTR